MYEKIFIWERSYDQLDLYSYLMRILATAVFMYADMWHKKSEVSMRMFDKLSSAKREPIRIMWQMTSNKLVVIP